MPPSSCLDRSMSRWISQTRWPPKSCVCVNMVFSDKASQRLCQRIRVLKGWAAVWAANYLYVNGTSPDSLFCASAAFDVCFQACLCVWDQGRSSGGRREFSKWHVRRWFSFVQRKFSNCGNDVITLCHNRACVMCYLPCQARISQMEIRGENCH